MGGSKNVGPHNVQAGNENRQRKTHGWFPTHLISNAPFSRYVWGISQQQQQQQQERWISISGMFGSVTMTSTNIIRHSKFFFGRQMTLHPLIGIEGDFVKSTVLESGSVCYVFCGW